MNALMPWLAVASSVLMIVGYEVLLLRGARRDPSTTARSTHRLLRAEWVNALSKQPNSEIVAVQALRNSLMSATITASTAGLLLMGSVSLIAASEVSTSRAFEQVPLRLCLEIALAMMLFAAYVCSALAMRYYHHSGFVLSMPVGSPGRKAHEPLASHYVQQAGVLYSWSLRCFLFAVPIATGLLNPFAMPIGAFTLLFVLRLFDRTPRAKIPAPPEHKA